MGKRLTGITAQGDIIKKVVMGEKLEKTQYVEESKLDPLVLSGDSSRAITEGGLIL